MTQQQSTPQERSTNRGLPNLLSDV